MCFVVVFVVFFVVFFIVFFVILFAIFFVIFFVWAGRAGQAAELAGQAALAAQALVG